MNRLFATVKRAEGEAATPDAPIRFVAATEGIKRDGLDLRAGEWDITNYARNPIITWAHDYSRPPIGKGRVGFEGADMVVDVDFDRADPYAADIERKVRAGYLNAVSVGWSDVDSGGATRHDLLEIAVVPVPADPGALAISRDIEPDGLRVGAVLNTRNREALEQAVDLIKGVLKSAKKEQPKEDAADEEEPKDEGRALWEALATRLNLKI